MVCDNADKQNVDGNKKGLHTTQQYRLSSFNKTMYNSDPLATRIVGEFAGRSSVSGVNDSVYLPTSFSRWHYYLVICHAIGHKSTYNNRSKFATKNIDSLIWTRLWFTSFGKTDFRKYRWLLICEWRQWFCLLIPFLQVALLYDHLSCHWPETHLQNTSKQKFKLIDKWKPRVGVFLVKEEATNHQGRTVIWSIRSSMAFLPVPLKQDIS